MHFVLTTALPALLLCTAASPNATPAPSTAWQEEVVYQIFPESFADSNGDGVGDLRGILSKVDYLHALGVDVVWLTPIFTSTHFDGGYDVSDYLAIDPKYGTLDDWYALRDGLHARGMKLMLDLVLNHSSDAHPWYVQEKELKRLQHQLTELVRRASPADGEAIVSILADPGSRSDMPQNPPEAAAGRAIDKFMAIDDTAAQAAGYPPKLTQLATLGRALEPCVAPARSCPDSELPFDDFYIWRDTPNNWTSIFSGSVWHAVPGTGAYSMSLFSEHQIDLNWRNPRLREAMAHVVATWEARGVDGLRLDSPGTLSKNPTFPDAPSERDNSTGRGHKNYTHLPEVHRFLRELARVYRPHFRTVGEVSFMHTDGAMGYSAVGHSEVDEVFLFDHLSYDCDGPKWCPKPFDILGFKRELAKQQRLMHGRAWVGNYFESHDQLRLPGRFGDAGANRVPSMKIFAALLMTLEGTPYIYQGQEIGMTNLPAGTIKKIAEVQDIEGRNYYDANVKLGKSPAKLFANITSRCRDNVRSGIQWSSAPNGGFTSHPGSVRINPNTATLNVDASIADPDSIWHAYQALIKLRRHHPSWVHGLMTDLLPEHPVVFAYSRSLDGEKSLVLLNFSRQPQAIRLPTGGLPQGPLEDVFSNYPSVPPLQAELSLRPYEARIIVGSTPTGSAVEVGPGQPPAGAPQPPETTPEACEGYGGCGVPLGE